MKKQYITILFILCATLGFSQEEDKEEIHPPLVETPNWGSEFFTFPISFASEIPYSGYEEAVFPPGWSQEDNQEFWSYAFAWKVDAAAALSTDDFKSNLQIYFDGLMSIKHIGNGATILPTSASIIKEENTGDLVKYKGSIYLYEGRYTKRMMTLYMNAEQFYCEKEQQAFVIFRFSPKLFEAPIWEDLMQVTLLNNVCD